jgi:nitroreductase
MSQKRAPQVRYKLLLKDKNLKRWYDNVARGSLVTADVYLRRLGHLIQNVCLISSSLGLKSCAIGGFLDDKLNELLRLDKNIESTLYAAAIGK